MDEKWDAFINNILTTNRIWYQNSHLMAILISYGVEQFYFQLIIKIPQIDKV